MEESSKYDIKDLWSTDLTETESESDDNEIFHFPGLESDQELDNDNNTMLNTTLSDVAINEVIPSEQNVVSEEVLDSLLKISNLQSIPTPQETFNTNSTSNYEDFDFDATNKENYQDILKLNENINLPDLVEDSLTPKYDDDSIPSTTTELTFTNPSISPYNPASTTNTPKPAKFKNEKITLSYFEPITPSRPTISKDVSPITLSHFENQTIKKSVSTTAIPDNMLNAIINDLTELKSMVNQLATPPKSQPNPLNHQLNPVIPKRSKSMKSFINYEVSSISKEIKKNNKIKSRSIQWNLNKEENLGLMEKIINKLENNPRKIKKINLPLIPIKSPPVLHHILQPLENFSLICASKLPKKSHAIPYVRNSGNIIEIHSLLSKTIQSFKNIVQKPNPPFRVNDKITFVADVGVKLNQDDKITFNCGSYLVQSEFPALHICCTNKGFYYWNSYQELIHGYKSLYSQNYGEIINKEIAAIKFFKRETIVYLCNGCMFQSNDIEKFNNHNNEILHKKYFQGCEKFERELSNLLFKN